MDKEFVVLDIIDKNENITQREISKKTNLSLGSVNLLLNKMAHDGLIKIKQIPLNRVAYILTPIGMAEKVNKTYSYIKSHYSYINETKEKIKKSLIKLKGNSKVVTILLEDDEVSELAKTAALEVRGIEFTENERDLKFDNLIITVNTENVNKLRDKGYTVLNILEII